jgi:hypothetical protein
MCHISAEAVVNLSILCFDGTVKVLVMFDPVYPLILGNNVFQEVKTDYSTGDMDLNFSSLYKFKTVIYENSPVTTCCF